MFSSLECRDVTGPDDNGNGIEGSREKDSLALVAIQKTNPDSDLNWDFSESLYEWRGVSLLGGRVYTLDLWSNALTELPVEITNLSPSQHLFVSNNSLSEENLDPAVVVWLDEYAPDWRDTQNLKQSKSLSIEVKLEFSSSPNEVHHEKFDVFGRKHKN